MRVILRTVQSSDLPVFFKQTDRQAADLAGFEPRSRADFDERWGRIISDPNIVLRAVEVEGVFADYVSAFSRNGRPEISYWFGREHWGRGIGRSAVIQFLAQHSERPIFGSVLAGNVASLAILRAAGFQTITENVDLDGRAEYLLKLD